MDTSNLHPIRNLVLDMDGVLWRGDTPLPGLSDFFELLIQKGIDFILATNNATKTAAEYVDRLGGFGIEVPAKKILGSAEATARYLGRHHPPGTRIYAIGEAGLRTALEGQGFTLLGEDGLLDADARAEVVVVGFDRHTCYRQLASAAVLINRGAAFVGTNPDVTYPSEHGSLPGAGSIQAFVETATGVSPTIVGKPNRIMFEEALRRLGGSRADTVMVGDRLNTDILGAKSAGLRAILVLSGVTGPEDLRGSDIKPDWVFDGLPQLTAFINSLSDKSVALPGNESNRD